MSPNSLSTTSAHSQFFNTEIKDDIVLSPAITPKLHHNDIQHTEIQCGESLLLNSNLSPTHDSLCGLSPDHYIDDITMLSESLSADLPPVCSVASDFITNVPTSCVSMAPQSPNSVLNVNNSMDSNQLQAPVSPMLGQGQSILIAGAVGAPKKNAQILPTKTSNGIRLVPQSQLGSNKVKIIPAVTATKGSPGTSVIKVQSFPTGSRTTGTQPTLKPKVQKQQVPLIQPRISQTTVTTNNTNTGMSGWG